MKSANGLSVRQHAKFGGHGQLLLRHQTAATAKTPNFPHVRAFQCPLGPSALPQLQASPPQNPNFFPGAGLRPCPTAAGPEIFQVHNYNKWRMRSGRKVPKHAPNGAAVRGERCQNGALLGDVRDGFSASGADCGTLAVACHGCRGLWGHSNRCGHPPVPRPSASPGAGGNCVALVGRWPLCVRRPRAAPPGLPAVPGALRRGAAPLGAPAKLGGSAPRTH